MGTGRKAWNCLYGSNSCQMISRRASRIKSFVVMDVMARAEALEKAGEEVIHLEVGEPDFDTPEVIREAAVRAMAEGKTHYTHALGLLDHSDDYYALMGSGSSVARCATRWSRGPTARSCHRE